MKDFLGLGSGQGSHDWWGDFEPWYHLYLYSDIVYLFVCVCQIV